MALGRPQKEFKEEYCEMLYEHMSKGLSVESFGGVIRVGKELLYKWFELHENFSNAKKEGTTASQLFWEKAGIEGLWGSKENSFNSVVWIFNMRNRFGWRDDP